MNKIAVIINARVNSSRVPNKLIRPFAGTTLLDIALKKLEGIKADAKYLAAHDPEIFEIGKKYSQRYLMRSAESVAQGEHNHKVTFAHYKIPNCDKIMVMNPCLPFTTVRDYQEAINHIHGESLTWTSVAYDYQIFLKQNGSPLNLENPDHISTTTTFPLTRMTNAFHIIDPNYFFKHGKFWDFSEGNPGYFYMNNPISSLDIDTEDEFKMCEILYKGGYGAN